MKARRIESILCKQDHFGFDGDTYTFRLEDGATVQMAQAFMEDYRPRAGGYLIQDDNQGMSYSLSKPREASAQCDFGLALAALKAGKSIARTGWNGKGMFLYLIKGTDLQSGLKYGFGEYAGEPQFVDTICMKTADNKLVVGWLASQTDMLANDWMVL